MKLTPVLTLAAALLWPACAQERRTAIEATAYKLDVQINPATQSLAATAQITILPLEDNISYGVFELHGALRVTRATDAAGRELAVMRQQQEQAVRVNFAELLAKGKPAVVTFTYEGRLSGQEESPVYGITFASIQPGSAYLLYPARWFPVTGYTSGRYTAELRVTVPAGMKVLSSGLGRSETTPAGQVFTYQTLQPGFPGSLAVVSGEARRVTSEGVRADIYFRPENAAQTQAWGDETGKVFTFLTSQFGVPPESALTIVETGPGAPNSYAAQGMLFVSPSAASRAPSQRLLANQLARQWFGGLISPSTRNHLWIANGMARYAEILYQEHLNGPAVLENEIRDLYVDALTVNDAPVRQAARFEDYSPELLASTGSKGAAVYHMLRCILGDKPWQQALRSLMDQFANKPVSTDDVRRAMENAGQQQLQGFFIQWLESTGAPEFSMEYTVYRTQKGFRVLGKITQDLDTFRMPVDLKIETEGNPEEKRVEVVGTSSEFVVDTFGKPKKVIIDPAGRVLRFSPQMRVQVAIRRGEQFAEVGEFGEALKEYQRALEVRRDSSLAHYRIAEVFFLQGNYQSAVNEFREAINGDREPSWTVVWSHINLGKVFDITQQRERARNEYQLAIRTKDNTQGAQEEAAKYLQTPYQRQERQ
jgi:aminopeptidase N